MEIANLTKKEQQIRDLIASCYSDSEIAKELKIELSTIATHKNHIFQKLLIFGKHRRLELIKQEMQQLKAENDELQEMNRNLSEKFANVCGGCFEQELREKYKQCLDEIEKIILKRQKEHYCYCDECSPFKEILQLIKQVEESYGNN